MGALLGQTWKCGRVVECTAFEKRHARKGIRGSNPLTSAAFELYAKFIPSWHCVEPREFSVRKRKTPQDLRGLLFETETVKSGGGRGEASQSFLSYLSAQVFIPEAYCADASTASEESAFDREAVHEAVSDCLENFFGGPVVEIVLRVSDICGLADELEEANFFSKISEVERFFVIELPDVAALFQFDPRLFGGCCAAICELHVVERIRRSVVAGVVYPAVIDAGNETLLDLSGSMGKAYVHLVPLPECSWRKVAEANELIIEHAIRIAQSGTASLLFFLVDHFDKVSTRNDSAVW